MHQRGGEVGQFRLIIHWYWILPHVFLNSSIWTFSNIQWSNIQWPWRNPVWNNAGKIIHLVGLDSRRQAVDKDPDSAERCGSDRIRCLSSQHWPPSSPPSLHFSDEGKSPSLRLTALTAAGGNSWNNSYPLAKWKTLSPPALPQPTMDRNIYLPPSPTSTLLSLVLLVPSPIISARQCCGSMTFWCGSGSADPCLWIMDSDPNPDPGSGSCYFRHWPSKC